MKIRHLSETEVHELRELWEEFEREVPEPPGTAPETWEDVYQQAEQNEHHDLRQPGNGVEKDDDGIACPCLHVADDQSREINGEEAGRVHDICKGKNDQRADGDEWRMQTLRERQTIDHQRDYSTA